MSKNDFPTRELAEDHLRSMGFRKLSRTAFGLGDIHRAYVTQYANRRGYSGRDGEATTTEGGYTVSYWPHIPDCVAHQNRRDMAGARAWQ